ncbi:MULTISPECIES: energy transducer TonB [Sphingomonas]|jgi:periplasmic protein TonB|uniref:Energy transducer TonB n=2 Tax=Sphingomonas zeae TaxID=1646122 RepID=A0A7Y6EH54_9SPHN|nr:MULTISPECIES: energy transducer TonB [Sphingomonas]MBB4048327.1 TonB family protein [Sphingomonas zeae]MDK8186215.1 energy transducer TonB [Sphingomonas zeae]MDK8215737.1 energy transducer TonB [Sphingomonas sp. UMB7805-LC452B]NUU46732.1 energy transducer TonB [Sphingomonas zeae]
MRGDERGLRNGVLAMVGLLLVLLLILVSLLIARAYDWHYRHVPRTLARDLPVAAVPPRLSGNPAVYFGPDSYPAEAQREGWEGRSSVAVQVDPNGTPTGCEVVRSSGHAVLDEATCRTVVRRVRFDPARDRQGRAVSGIYRPINVRWQLPPESKPGE